MIKKIDFKDYPALKKTSSIITIISRRGKKYNLVLDVKHDKIGLTFYDKNLKLKISSINKLSDYIKHIETLILNRNISNKTKDGKNGKSINNKN